jgi:hypothetical protein
MVEIKKTSRRRNDVIHSNIVGIRAGDPPRLVLQINKRRHGELHIRREELSVADLKAIKGEILRLTGELAVLSLGLMQFQEHDDESGTAALLKLQEIRQRTTTRESPSPPSEPE